MGDGRWAIEIEKSSAPTIGRGFAIASDDLVAERGIIVHKGDATYPCAVASKPSHCSMPLKQWDMQTIKKADLEPDKNRA